MTLSNDILIQIFKFISIKDRQNVILVCKKFALLMENIKYEIVNLQLSYSEILSYLTKNERLKYRQDLENIELIIRKNKLLDDQRGGPFPVEIYAYRIIYHPSFLHEISKFVYKMMSFVNFYKKNGFFPNELNKSDQNSLFELIKKETIVNDIVYACYVKTINSNLQHINLDQIIHHAINNSIILILRDSNTKFSLTI